MKKVFLKISAYLLIGCITIFNILIQIIVNLILVPLLIWHKIFKRKNRF